ncbi:MAG TPA: tyrosine-type recombinase/integrase [Streptosporangiaceae bacterium]|nr:tyrosine-type recombinase/integrase [Streptosporangiaceae bacterium]
MSAVAATIPGMLIDQAAALIPAESPGAVPRPGQAGHPGAAAAAELVARVRAELLAAAWLMSLPSARTRRAYAGDLRSWLAWLAERGVDVLAAGRVHVDLWARGQQDAGAGPASVRRRLSALSSFYRYCAAHDLVERIPTAGVARPVVDPDYTATVGLTREQARALVAAADADTGLQALRTAAVIRLLLHNALRVDEACAAGVADLGADAGHRVLRVTRKGARRARVPLTPATAAALDAYLEDRAGLAGAGELAGPLLATATGGRLRQAHLWELVRRLARAAGIETWDRLSPHSLRHSAITLSLDADAAMRDVQDYAGHKDPRTTRRYDHSRDNLDRNAAYVVAAYLA